LETELDSLPRNDYVLPSGIRMKYTEYHLALRSVKAKGESHED